jgi:hypothetical protein
MYLNQVTSELPELHEDVMNIPCGEDYDPVLASVFDDLSGRMLLLPQDAGGSNNAGVMTYSHVPQLQEENQSHGFCTLEDKERDCEDGNIFLNLDAESDGEDDAVGTLSNSKSANSSLHSIPDEALLTATSTPLKASTPVALALFELASFTKQDIFQSSPLTPSSATTSAATSACDITLGCQISGNMQQSYGVQRSYMHPNPPGNTHSSGGANISQMQFGPPTTTRTRPFVGVRGGDAATVQQAPESAPPRRYKIMQPSKFCHVCVRSGELVTLAPCANVTTGVCRKAICRKCFEKHGHVEEWDIACKNNALLAEAPFQAKAVYPSLLGLAFIAAICAQTQHSAKSMLERTKGAILCLSSVKWRRPAPPAKGQAPLLIMVQCTTGCSPSAEEFGGPQGHIPAAKQPHTLLIL